LFNGSRKSNSATPCQAPSTRKKNGIPGNKKSSDIIDALLKSSKPGTGEKGEEKRATEERETQEECQKETAAVNLEDLSRGDLQKLAKEHGVKASLKTADLRSKLTAIMSPKDDEASQEEAEGGEEMNVDSSENGEKETSQVPADKDWDTFNMYESLGSFQNYLNATIKEVAPVALLDSKVSKTYAKSMMYVATRLCTKLKEFFPETSADFDSLEEKFRESGILPGELAKHACNDVKQFKSEENGTQLLIYRIILTHVCKDPTVATVISAVCDYIFKEITELGSNCFRDEQKVYIWWILKNDGRLLKDLIMSSEGKDDDEQEDISTLRARYESSSIPFMCISSAVEQDDELKALWKQLDLEFICYEEHTKSMEGSYNIPLERARNRRMKQMREARVTKFGLDAGFSMFDDDLEAAAPLNYSELKYFCTKYPPVDEDGKTDDEEGICVGDDVKTPMENVRGASGNIHLSVEHSVG